MIFFICTLYSLSLASQSLTNQKFYFGQASDLKSKKWVYTEVHTLEHNSNGLDKKISTEYFDPNGKKIAQIASTFEINELVPSVVFSDLRSDVQETIELSADQKKVTLKKITQGKVSQKEIPLDETFVLGQGFNNFVLKKWDDLIAKKNIPFKFIVPAELDYFSFEAFISKKTDDGVLQFSIRLGSWVLRQFLKPIVVTYNAKQKKLLTYEGLSNLSDQNGKAQNVKIIYSDSDPRLKL
jgi:hypothetical protein